MPRASSLAKGPKSGVATEVIDTCFNSTNKLALYSPAILSLPDLIVAEPDHFGVADWDDTQRQIRAALATVPVPPGEERIKVEQLCPVRPGQGICPSQQQSSTRSLRLVREWEGKLDRAVPIFELRRGTNTKQMMDNSALPVLMEHEDDLATDQFALWVHARRTEKRGISSKKLLEAFESDQSARILEYATPNGYDDLGMSGILGTSRIEFVLPAGLKKNGVFQSDAVKAFFDPKKHQSSTAAQKIHDLAGKIPLHRQQRWYPDTPFHPLSDLPHDIQVQLEFEVIRIVFFMGSLSRMAMRDVLVRLGIDVPHSVPSHAAARHHQQELDVWQSVSRVVEVRVATERAVKRRGDLKDAADAAAVSPGWNLLVRADNSRSGSVGLTTYEWRLTAAGQQLKAELVEQYGIQPAHGDYVPPPLSPLLLHYPPFRTIERVNATPPDRRVLLTMPKVDLDKLDASARNDLIETIKNKQLSCSIRHCPLNIDTLDEDGQPLPFGLHERSTYSPYAWGDDDKALCPAHAELALIDLASGVPEKEFFKELAMTNRQQQLAVSLLEKYSPIYRCPYGCRRVFGRSAGRVAGGFEGGRGAPDVSKAGYGMHNLFTCNGCVGRFSEPHLAAIKSMSAEVDGLDAWDRRDLTSIKYPDFFTTRTYLCFTCGAKGQTSRYVKLIVDGEMACPSCYFKKANEEADENGLEPASRFNAGHLSQPSLETLRKICAKIAKLPTLSTLNQCARALRSGTSVPHPKLLLDYLQDDKLMSRILNEKGYEEMLQFLGRVNGDGDGAATEDEV